MRKLSLVILMSVITIAFAVSCKTESKKGIEVLDRTGQENTSKPETFDDIIQGKTPVIVDFYAEWCGPCKIMSPVLEEIQSELGEKVRVVKVNVDVEKDLASRFGIQSIPTIYIFKEGKAIYKQLGVQEKEVIVNAVLNAQ